MKIFELREPKISKSEETVAKNYLRKGSMTYVADSEFGEDEEELINKLSKLGWQRLGHGNFSYVFSNPRKSYVLKLAMVSDPGYAEYVKLIKAHPNKYFPHLSDLKTLKSGGETFGMYLIEKLVEMEAPWGEIYSKILRTMIGGAGALTIQNISAPSNYTQANWQSILEKVLSNDEFVTAIKLVASWAKKSKFKIDMHAGNIMQRKDGTAVITDPYSFIESSEKQDYGGWDDDGW
jgi:hypothetical protein